MFKRLLPRYVSAPRDANRVPGLITADSSTGAADVPSSLSVAGVVAQMVAVVDGSGNQVTAFSGGLSAAPLNGQAKIAVTGTAVRLGSNTLINGIIVTALSTNVASIVIGISTVHNVIDGTGDGYILAAGGSVSWAVSNSNALYINGTAGDIVSFAGS